jgi:hypothetical protein
MTPVLLAALAIAPAAPSAAEYFPLRPGTRMVYEEKSLEASVTTDVVGQPVEVAGSAAVPVTTYQNGSVVNTTFYRVGPDLVSIVAHDKDHPLKSPLPVFKLPADRKSDWTFFGNIGTEKEPEGLSMKGEAQFKGEREVLGTKVPILEVRITASVGGGRSKEDVEQVAIYGKGIGLVELTSITKIGKRKAASVLRLTKIETPKEGG